MQTKHLVVMQEGTMLMRRIVEHVEIAHPATDTAKLVASPPRGTSARADR